MESAARKTTPAHLAQGKIKIGIPEHNYSHEGQANLDRPDAIVMITWNTTQTFNSKGQPSDRDNDK
jgi:hypothetical protein